MSVAVSIPSITDPKHAVGAAFDPAAMRFANAQSWRAIDRMVEAFEPGLRESEARELCMKILADLGMERIWHPPHVRFGSNTTKTYNEKGDGDPELGEDVGATFTTGNDPDKAACAAAARALFDDVACAWKADNLSGASLYDYADRKARHMGWTLNLDIQGHRVSEYPHAVYKAGDLGQFDGVPAAGLWILEIQIAHPQKPFGAFYEDLLI